MSKDKIVCTRLVTSDYELLRRLALSDDQRISKKLRRIIKKAIKAVGDKEEKE